MATFQDGCIFCKIVKGESPSESIYEDDDLICIKDINPASDHHYLIIPKNHIANAKELKLEDEPLFDKIVDTVEVVAAQQGLDLGSTRTGFHWPPFNTVNHLHLHVIYPVENMNFLKRQMFRPNSLWFVSTDYVKSRFNVAS
ncbi:Similar to hint3: Histidine triad nucleotide-binding protein 3 (Xenopus tropicalis) [Cotesia congregata]|uniref:Adenosine 5'-monophosphoramidase HINT3 n=1 Tax=Cotesia congregata TaxID=51543 RepID=A0A8J2HGA0_COTCN|nr:Similar to hint3: Histidine triad nucleotide-binding protein 3 (Xenopus tropicalis) [Cotesia congregata]